VNRRLQYRFIAAMLLVLIVLSVIALATVYLTLWVTLHTFELQHDPISVALFTTLGLSIALELLIVAPFVIWLGVLLTHKVAGPLVRINASLAQMAAGHYDVSIRLRRGDLLEELAEGINHLAASLRSRR
jgi:nitrogen fixation/metabolism regulation signal transduction histidine kinase